MRRGHRQADQAYRPRRKTVTHWSKTFPRRRPGSSGRNFSSWGGLGLSAVGGKPPPTRMRKKPCWFVAEKMLKGPFDLSGHAESIACRVEHVDGILGADGYYVPALPKRRTDRQRRPRRQGVEGQVAVIDSMRGGRRTLHPQGQPQEAHSPPAPASGRGSQQAPQYALVTWPT